MIQESTSTSFIEVIDVLDRFFSLRERSETLNGSILLRSTSCKPFLEGNAAGLHLQLSEPGVLHFHGRSVELRLTKEGREKATRHYTSKISLLVQKGILTKSGYWHRQLSNGYFWQTEDTFFIWTGYLVRPSVQSSILVSGAFNRRCAVRVREYVIPQSDEFVPLIICVDVSTHATREIWLDTELACLLPLGAGNRISMSRLKDRPEIGRGWVEFYDSEYLNRRAAGRYAGKYKSMTAANDEALETSNGEAELVLAAGPPWHRIRTFHRFATAEGWRKDHPLKGSLHYAEIQNISDLDFRWDGLAARDIKSTIANGAKRFIREWTKLYGVEALESIEWISHYIFPTHRGDPFVSITPWVFARTNAGWSSLIDSAHFEGLDGLRGLIATDKYFGVVPLWQFLRPGRFHIPKHAVLARLVPLPRHLLRKGGAPSVRPLALKTIQ